MPSEKPASSAPEHKPLIDGSKAGADLEKIAIGYQRKIVEVMAPELREFNDWLASLAGRDFATLKEADEIVRKITQFIETAQLVLVFGKTKVTIRPVTKGRAKATIQLRTRDSKQRHVSASSTFPLLHVISQHSSSGSKAPFDEKRHVAESPEEIAHAERDDLDEARKARANDQPFLDHLQAHLDKIAKRNFESYELARAEIRRIMGFVRDAQVRLLYEGTPVTLNAFPKKLIRAKAMKTYFQARRADRSQKPLVTQDSPPQVQAELQAG